MAGRSSRRMTAVEALEMFPVGDPRRADILRQLQTGRPLPEEKAPAAVKKGKYGNLKIVEGGMQFDSKREYRRWRVLKMWLDCGLITDLQRQVPFRFEVNGVECFTYYADFTYRQAQTLVVEDAKGHRTAVYKLKKRLVEAKFGIVIHEV